MRAEQNRIKAKNKLAKATQRLVFYHQLQENHNLTREFSNEKVHKQENYEKPTIKSLRRQCLQEVGRESADKQNRGELFSKCKQKIERQEHKYNAQMQVLK